MPFHPYNQDLRHLPYIHGVRACTRDFAVLTTLDCTDFPYLHHQVDARLNILDMVFQIGCQISDKRNLLGIRDELGRSLLMQAVMSNNVQISRYFLENGVDVDDGGEIHSNKTPLMQAAAAGNKDLCKILLEFGADPSLKDRLGRTVAEQVAMLGKDDILNFLDMQIMATAAQPRKAQYPDELVEIDEATETLIWHSLIAEVSSPAVMECHHDSHTWTCPDCPWP